MNAAGKKRHGLSALLFLIAAVAVWLAAEAVVLGGGPGIAWAFVLGGKLGLGFVVWLAVSDSFSRSWGAPEIAPVIYFVMAACAYALLWWLGVSLRDSVPYVLVGLMYLGRNVAKAVT